MDGRGAKLPVSVYSIVPGIKLAVSYKFSFEVYLLFLDYHTEMGELRCACKVADVRQIACTYKSEDEISYSCEVELLAIITTMNVKSILDGTRVYPGSRTREVDLVPDSAHVKGNCMSIVTWGRGDGMFRSGKKGCAPHRQVSHNKDLDRPEWPQRQGGDGREADRHYVQGDERAS